MVGNVVVPFVQFKQQLRELMSAIDLTTPHYIRCINPNAEKAPNKFNKDEVLRALPSTAIERAWSRLSTHARSACLVRSACMCWGALRYHVALQCDARRCDLLHASTQHATCARHNATCNIERLLTSSWDWD